MFPIWINPVHWIVSAVCKEVKSAYCFRIKVIYAVCVYETACFGVVISCLKIIKLCLGVVVIAAVTERVNIAYIGRSIIRYLKNLTPGVVDVRCNLCFGRVIDSYNISLKVFPVVVIYAVISEAYYSACAVVISKCLSPVGFLEDSVTVKGICCVVLLVAYTVGTILEGVASVACESSYVSPGKGNVAVNLGNTL